MANLNLPGTAGDDTLIGGSGNDTLTGGNGNDSLVGGSGNDVLDGGAGNDTLDGGTGNDKVLGGDGNDYVYVSSGNDTLDGGTGLNTLDASKINSGLTIDLVAGKITGAVNQTISNFQTILGTGSADAINGSTAAEYIDSGSGSDTISGGGGNDTIFGGNGNDSITGGSGNSVIDGGAGNDTLIGGSGNDSITGGTGSDSLSGGDGNDTLNGGDGSDTIAGGNGNDTIISSIGSDHITGDAGNDTFVYSTTISGTSAQSFDGGTGIDTLEVHLTPAQLTVAVQAELAAFQGFVANPLNAGKTFQFSALGNLQVKNVEFLNLVVDQTNAAPVIDQQVSTTTLAGSHTAALTGTIAATDANGDALSYSVQSAPQHGAVTFTDGNGHYTYTAGNYVGADSFTLQVNDGFGGVATQIVNVTTTNAGPVVDPASTHTLTVAHKASTAGIIATTDADGDPASYSVQSAPLHGAVTFTDGNGHYTYTVGNYVGTDSFTLQVADGFGGVATEHVDVNVTNAAPILDPVSTTALKVAHNAVIAGLIQAADPDGDQLSYSVQTGPQHGAVTFTDGNGHYTYTAGNYVGADSFTLQVADGFGGVATEHVDVNVTNAAPTISASGTTTSIGAIHYQSVSGSILATDPNGDQLTYSVQTGPQHGTLAFTDGNGHYVYTAGDFAGTDTFTVGVDDGHGGTAYQTVAVDLIGTTNDAAATSAVTVNLSTGSGLTSDQALHTIDVVGSNYADNITGDAHDNTLSGGAGNDTLSGGDGNDSLYGGTGNDNLSGANGNDYLDGGDGNDALNGGAGNDTLVGGAGNDGFFGGGGNDLVYGGDGNDRIYGDGGNDTIFGGAGNDTLTGGTQNGIGDQGNDTFAWTRNDVLGGGGPAANLDHITDFGAGDKLDFSQLFNGAHPAVANVVHVLDTAAGTVVSADLGSGFVDIVVLDGVHGVTVDTLDQQHAIII